MSRRTETIDAGYFERLYQGDADPWRFGSSAYESGKYAATLAALRRSRYAAALEVGCSIGVFTALLAPRCERLLAIDGSPTAIEAAARACAACPQVELRQCTVPEAFPPGRHDLIVLSEVLYYLVPADLDRVAAACDVGLTPGGEIVLCHWLGETDYPLSGRDASRRFTAAMVGKGCRHTLLHDDTYRLDHLTRA